MPADSKLHQAAPGPKTGATRLKGDLLAAFGAAALWLGLSIAVYGFLW